MHHNLIKYLNNLGISVRLATNDLNISNWNRWITTPVNGYLDIGNEPIKIDDINYIEIDCLIINITIIIVKTLNRYCIKFFQGNCNFP